MQVDSVSLQSDDRALILVIDDDVHFREGVVSFLKRRRYETLEAADAQTAYELAVIHQPTTSIIDLILPEHPRATAHKERNEGIELARRLKRISPTMGIILISAFGDRSDTVLQLAAEGTRGIAYLVKGYQTSAAVLLQALEETRAGHVLIRSNEAGISSPLAERFWARLSPQETPYIRRAVELIHEHLTQREREVAFALAHAQTVQGTADMLHIAVGTAEKHINHIYSKLELDRTELLVPPLRKSLLLAKACWLFDMLGGGKEG